jgi:hypothetical protein
MKLYSLLIGLLISNLCWSQEKILLLGNTKQLCLTDSNSQFMSCEKIPERLAEFDAIMVFSSAHSKLSSYDIDQIILFLTDGGGLYIGSENWPLQSEGRLLTERIYSKSAWASTENTRTAISNNGLFSDVREFPPGLTPVVFPLDYQLNVEVWYNDEPLILTGKIGSGKILIDGGYSRFYCQSLGKQENEVLKIVLDYLTEP